METQPEEISPAKFFPRMATASIGRTWSELAFIEIQKANPGLDLQSPDWGIAVTLPGPRLSTFESNHDMGDDESGASV